MKMTSAMMPTNTSGRRNDGCSGSDLRAAEPDGNGRPDIQTPSGRGNIKN